MKNIIICGAGAIGENIARYLMCYKTQITIIDADQTLVNKISQDLQVYAICGFPSYPETLAMANAATAHMLIATTDIDEVNIMACSIASKFFHVPQTIAKLSSQSYLAPDYSALFKENFNSISHFFSPEEDTACAAINIMSTPGAGLVLPFCGNLLLVGVWITEEAPACHTSIAQLSRLLPGIEIPILAIKRKGVVSLPGSHQALHPQDMLYFLSHRSTVETFLSLFTKNKKKCKKIVIVGGGQTAVALGRQAEIMFPKSKLTIVESSPERSHQLTSLLPQAQIVSGSGLNHKVLDEACDPKEYFVAATSDDKTNILAGILSKKIYSCQTIAIIKTSSFYESIIMNLGIDAVLNPHVLIARHVLQQLLSNCMQNVFPLGLQHLLVTISVSSCSPVVGSSVESLCMKGDIHVAGVIRNQMLCHNKKDLFRVGDQVVLGLSIRALSAVEKAFGER